MSTTSSGSVYGTYTSLPFGDGWGNTSGNDDNTFDDFAQMWDGGSNSHAQYREYSHSQGRWMQPDPYSGSYDFSNPQSLNRYSYVLNNPLAMTDPSGQFTQGPAAYVGTAICGPECGAIAAIASGVGELLVGLFGFGGPSFHGSLHPRPTDTGTWDGNFGESLGIGNQVPQYDWAIAPALGLPDPGCDFGSCGGGSSNILGASSAVLVHYPFNSQVIFPEIAFLNWWERQDTKPHGLWTYGNWCGQGGAGNPIDGHDTNCMLHDYCYYRHHFTATSNFDLLPLDQRAQLQGCNQQLCNAEGELGGWTADQVRGYFYGIPSNGNGCR